MFDLTVDSKYEVVSPECLQGMLILLLMLA